MSSMSSSMVQLASCSRRCKRASATRKHATSKATRSCLHACHTSLAAFVSTLMTSHVARNDAAREPRSQPVFRPGACCSIV